MLRGSNVEKEALNEESLRSWFRFSHPFIKVETSKTKCYSERSLKSSFSHASFILKSWEMVCWRCICPYPCTLPNLLEGVLQNRSSFCTFSGLALVSIFSFCLKNAPRNVSEQEIGSPEQAVKT